MMPYGRAAEAGGIAMVGVVISWALIVALLIVAACRLVAHDRSMILIWLNAGTFYLYLPAYVTFAIALAVRNLPLAAASAVVLGFHLYWVAPDLSWSARAPLPDANLPQLRVFSSNLLMVNATPDGIVDEILASAADVIVVQEFSQRWQEAFARRGVFETYPHQVGTVREDSFGTSILASRPLENAEVWEVEGLPMTRATVNAHGVKIRLINVHTLPPRRFDYVETWHLQMHQLVNVVEKSTGPLILIGDFNATQHSVWYARLIRAGVRDAHRERGRGLATTFPNGMFRVPPLRLDHALISPELTCLDVREGVGAGSDHRPLLVDLLVRP